MKAETLRLRFENEGLNGLVPWCWDINLKKCNPAERTKMIRLINCLIKEDPEVGLQVYNDQSLLFSIKKKEVQNGFCELLSLSELQPGLTYEKEITEFMAVIKQLKAGIIDKNVMIEM